MLLDARGVLYPQLSKYSRKVPNIMVTRSLHVARHSSLYTNVIPIIIEDEIAREWGYAHEGDIFAVVEGACQTTVSGIPQVGAFQLITVE